MTAVFEKNHYLVNGKLSGKYGRPSLMDRNQMEDITNYLITTHGPQTFQPYLSVPIGSLLGKDDNSGGNGYHVDPAQCQGHAATDF